MDDSETRWISTFTRPKGGSQFHPIGCCVCCWFHSQMRRVTQTGKHIAACNMEYENVWDLTMVCFYCYLCLPAKCTRRGLVGHHAQLLTPGHDGFQPLLYGCFLKWWYPQIIHFNRVFHCKPSILGISIFGNTHIDSMKILKKRTCYMVILHPQISLVLQPAATSGPDHNGDLPETNTSQLKIGRRPQKERIVFQPSSPKFVKLMVCIALLWSLSGSPTNPLNNPSFFFIAQLISWFCFPVVFC